MKITEDYVTFETAKLLKENGFNVMCDSMYIPDIRHNGKSISFDEELDLKDEGRGDEIEVVEGGEESKLPGTRKSVVKLLKMDNDL